MRQFSIKNEQAADLLEQIISFTGEGKTEAVIHALELYQSNLLGNRDAAATIAAIRQHVHPHIAPEYKGRVPSKAELEAELGMP